MIGHRREGLRRACALKLVLGKVATRGTELRRYSRDWSGVVAYGVPVPHMTTAATFPGHEPDLVEETLERVHPLTVVRGPR